MKIWKFETHHLSVSVVIVVDTLLQYLAHYSSLFLRKRLRRGRDWNSVKFEMCLAYEDLKWSQIWDISIWWTPYNKCIRMHETFRKTNHYEQGRENGAKDNSEEMDGRRYQERYGKTEDNKIWVLNLRYYLTACWAASSSNLKKSFWQSSSMLFARIILPAEGGSKTNQLGTWS